MSDGYVLCGFTYHAIVGLAGRMANLDAVLQPRDKSQASRVRVACACGRFGACAPPSTTKVQRMLHNGYNGEEFFRRIARSSKFARSHSLCNFSVNRYRLLRLYHVTDVRSYKRKQSIAQGVKSSSLVKDTGSL